MSQLATGVDPRPSGDFLLLWEAYMRRAGPGRPRVPASSTTERKARTRAHPVRPNPRRSDQRSTAARDPLREAQTKTNEGLSACLEGRRKA